MIRALVFDFDGLILDTETPTYQAWQEIYADYQRDLSLAAWSACVGTSADAFDPYAHLEAMLGYEVDRKALHVRHRKREHELVCAQPILPGVMDYLVAARSQGLKIGVASSSSRDWVVGHLSRLTLLSFFDCVKVSDDVELVKPDPALYQLAVSTLEVQPGEAVAFEDSPNGALAAKRAGLFCVAVPNHLTQQLVFGEVDLQVSSLADLSLEQLLLEIAK